ncbi:MAG: hypothetical protein ABTA23_12180 [Solibacillus sp.]
MAVGNRILCDQDGEIIVELGEITGSMTSRKPITQVHVIEIPYGSIDYLKNIITSIDIETMQPILQSVEPPVSDEQRHIQELEDALLLAVDAETGGIL